MQLRLAIFVALIACSFAFLRSPAQNKQAKKDVVPHGQASMPGPALSPQEALKKMEVPPGFRVELVAAEPDIVNPVAMTFDERGRIWITESLEYPKKAAGPGRDRVKVLESTRGDGKFDKVTTVIEGLNIPSGIAIGHGGVWVANAPDILYYPFADFATPKLGKPEVVVTGFGRFDTHELPNSLTWGPDGWLYGLNGVFNRSVVKQDGKTFDFTCALFKIHPKTKKFELFCEGTSNPWGLAINENGDFFVSACVIDHLWHLTETGYYHRQGGPYPPYTWKIGSIVKHKHQKAAYCGLVWFDSDAYPPEYREKLYMGNIHGNAINCDELTRDGSTYFAKTRPDFLRANDPWFMPVAQKVGPDGCMYILDWYDRYHCYQDANRDPAGIDRLKGRLYRIVYKDYKPAGTFDLNSDKDLLKKLDHPNIYFRETAQRVLAERKEATSPLQAIACNNPAPSRRARLHAIWTLIGQEEIGKLGTNVDGQLIGDPDPTIRAWMIRAMALRGNLASLVRDKVRDRSTDVILQVAIAAPKFKSLDSMQILTQALESCGDDRLIPHIVWQNLHPLLEKDGERFLTLASKIDLAKSPGVAKVLPRAIDRILGNTSGDPALVVRFIEKLAGEKKTEPARLCLAGLAAKIQNNEVPAKQLDVLAKDFTPALLKIAEDSQAPLALDAAIVLASMKNERGLILTGEFFAHRGNPEADRLRAFAPHAAAGHRAYLPSVGRVVTLKEGSIDFRSQLLSMLSRLDDASIANMALQGYSSMEPELQPKAIELLTQRPSWARTLFQEIAARNISKDVINVNQARRLLATKDAELARLVAKHWGVPRDGRNPERERLVAQYRELFTKTPGDPKAGVAVFNKVCAQCHKIHGQGVDVGPDITVNGRSDFDQLLSNIFDPSLVIGSGYQAVLVNTKQGQVITGLMVEDNAQRIVLKVQGGELKTIARADVDEQVTSKLSMMPEDLEKQLRPQEIVDLLSYLSLDRPPDDPKTRKIPGTPR